MNKAYILSTCNTCQRILNEVEWSDEVQDVKEKNIDAKTLTALAKEYGSYEALFNKRAIKYRSMGLKDQGLSDQEFKKWILKEYTFIKRPIFFVGEKSFVGNSKKVVAALKEELGVK
jgi:arsenate reductase